MNFLFSGNEKLPKSDVEYIFIQGMKGGYFRDVNKGWIFEDDTTMSFFNWDKTEPDLTAPINYLSLHIKYNFKCHDIWDNFKGMPLCQKREKRSMFSVS